MKEKSIVNEDSPRKSRTGEFDVNWDLVLSYEYRNRFYKVSTNEKVIDAILLRCKWMLYHRDGKNSEEIYAIDLDSVEEIARIINQNIAFGIKRDKAFTTKLNESDKKNKHILLIHNHPRGMPPSVGDINELKKNKNACGITVGHNGSIYFYTRPNKHINDSEYWIALKKYSIYNEHTGMEKALEYISQKYDFIFRTL